MLLPWTRRRLLSDAEHLGRWGQAKAETHLKKMGLRVIARNWTCRGGELDLVMVDRDTTLVFVEVKTRARETFQPAETAITEVKKARLALAARHFVGSHRIDDRPLRFDVVTVVLGRRGNPEVRHYTHAFRP